MATRPAARSQRGRPRKLRLGAADQAIIAWLISTHRPHLQRVATAAAISTKHLRKVIKGQRGLDGGPSALINSLLTGPPGHSLSSLPSPSSYRLSTPPTSPTDVNHHVFIDQLELAFQVTRYPSDEMIEPWRTLGEVKHQPYSKWWDLTVNGDGWDFRAFAPSKSCFRYHYHARLQLKSKALAQGRGAELFRAFVAPWVDVRSLRVTRIDIAVDQDLDVLRILPFRWFPANPSVPSVSRRILQRLWAGEFSGRHANPGHDSHRG